MSVRTLSLLSLGTLLTVGGHAVFGQSNAPIPIVGPDLVAPQQPSAPSGLGALKDRPDAPAPDALAPGTAAAPDSGDLLGATYENRGAGIALRPPAGSKTVRKMGNEEIVEFVNEKRKWQLKVMLITTRDPIGLTTSTDLSGRETQGIMEITKERVVRALPGAVPEKKFLREDVVNIGDGVPSEDPTVHVPNVGMLALRYTLGLERFLGQQAIIQANERNYYLITLISPGKAAPKKENIAGDPAPAAPDAKAPVADDAGESLEAADPGEKLAVEAFRQVIDSVKLLDRSKLKQEQDQRLFATRALYVNLNEKKLTAALDPKQFYRLIRKGKDVGYVYTVEETADGIPQPNQVKANEKAGMGVASGEKGVLIGTRSRMIPEDSNIQIDAESWMFVTHDRRHEDWSSLIVTLDRKTGGRDHIAEFGTSDKSNTVALDKAAVERFVQGDKDDPKQPPVKQRDDYFLNVTHVAKQGSPEPVSRALPPFYLPQALSKMLPRLVDYKKPHQYLFAQYVGDSRQVMLRYVDVEQLQKVTLAGRMIRAIPIRDRLTLGGSVTTHFISEKGEYLGSENADSEIAVIPTDEKTLQELWKDADLSRPGNVAQPAAAVTTPARPTMAEQDLGSTGVTAPRRPQPVRRPTQAPLGQ